MAKLVRIDGGDVYEHPLDREPLTIGKAPDNRLVLEHTQVSRHHCVIRQSEGGRIQIEDLGSTNGTSVNGDPIELSILKVGDEITIGPFQYRIEEESAAKAPPKLAPAKAPVAAPTDDLEINLEDDLVIDLEDDDPAPSPSASPAAEESADLEISLTSPCFLVFEKGPRSGERIELSGQRFTIGRTPKNDLTINSTQVSSAHAEIVDEGLGWTLRDLGSTNGTFVDDERIDEESLEHGQRVRFGDQRLVFWDSSVAEVEELEAQEAAEAEAVHHVSAAEVPTKGKGGAIAAFFLLIVLFGGMGWVYYQYGMSRSSEGKLGTVSGNVLPAEVASFEPGDGERAWRPSSDENEGTFSMVATPVHAGAGALETRVDEEIPFAVATWQGRMTVEPERRYRLQGFARTDEGAFGALRLRFLAETRDENDEPLTTELGAGVPSWITGRGEGPNGFVTFSGEVRAPAGATHAQVDCLAIGTGRVVLDDVAVVPSAHGDRLEIDSQGFEFGFDGATFDLVRVGELLLTGGGVTIESGERSWPQETFFAADASRSSPSWSGTFHIGASSAKLEQEVSQNEEGVTVSYQLDGLPADARVVLRYDIHSELMSEGVAAIAGEDTFEYGGAFSKEGASAVIFGRGENRLRFKTSVPGDVSATAKGEGFLVQHVLPGRSFTLSVKTSFVEERREGNRLLTEAQDHLRSGEQGQAFEIYGRIIQDFPFDPALQEKARTARDQLRREAEQGLADVQKRIADASFFHHPASFEEAIALADDLEQRFEGSEYAGKAAEVREAAQAEADEFRLASEEERAQRLFRMAELAEKRKDRQALANEIFRMVAQLYPDTEHGRKAAAR